MATSRWHLGFVFGSEPIFGILVRLYASDESFIHHCDVGTVLYEIQGFLFGCIHVIRYVISSIICSRMLSDNLRKIIGSQLIANPYNSYV